MTHGNGDSISYRLDRADECVAEAQLLRDAGHWNASVSRLYYACFYAVSALLLTKDLSSAKHSGVRSLFGRFFVNAGLIDRDLAAVFNELFEARQQSDYEDFFEAIPKEVQAYLPRVEELVAEIRSLIDS